MRFIYLSKTVDLSFNSSHDSFTSWLELRNLSWFGANEVDISNFATLELYIHALSYTLKLANHIVKAIINNNVMPFKVAPQEELFYFLLNVQTHVLLMKRLHRRIRQRKMMKLFPLNFLVLQYQHRQIRKHQK